MWSFCFYAKTQAASALDQETRDASSRLNRPTRLYGLRRINWPSQSPSIPEPMSLEYDTTDLLNPPSGLVPRLLFVQADSPSCDCSQVDCAYYSETLVEIDEDPREAIKKEMIERGALVNILIGHRCNRPCYCRQGRVWTRNSARFTIE